MKAFLVAACLLLTGTVQAFDHRPAVDSFRHELEHMDRPAIAARADMALDNMIKTSVYILRHRGYRTEAERIEREWLPLRNRLTEMLASNLEVPEEYAPLSLWLSDWYHTVKYVLGDAFCEALHFDDVQVLNWGTPVVFHMDAIGEAQPDAGHYELYFDPWCGVVTYWTVWGACTGATWGAGDFVFCTPAAMVGESLMFYAVAPQFSDQAWKLFYP